MENGGSGTAGKVRRLNTVQVKEMVWAWEGWGEGEIQDVFTGD